MNILTLGEILGFDLVNFPSNSFPSANAQKLSMIYKNAIKVIYKTKQSINS